MKSEKLSNWAFWSLLLSVLILSAGGHLVGGDEETMYRVTQNLLNGQGIAVGRESLTIPSTQTPLFLPRQNESIETTSAIPGRDGQTYSKYGMGQSLAAIPLYLAGNVWGAIFENKTDTARLAVSWLNAIALAGVGALLAHFGETLGYQRNTSRVAALGAIFSSFAWPYTKTFYPQPSTALLLLGAVYAAYRWRQTTENRWLWISASAVGLMLLFRLSAAIAIPALFIYIVAVSPPEKRWQAVLPFGVAGFLSLSATGLYNWQRFGSPLTTGYAEVAWTTPILNGLYGLLFSPGKGVFLYAPLLLLSLAALAIFYKRFRAETWLLIGLWLGFFLFYAPYNFWTGGFNWGPRFLLPVVIVSHLPLCALLESTQIKWRRLIFWSLFALGFFLQFPAILVDHSRYLTTQLAENPNQAQAYKETIYQLEKSPLAKQWPTALELATAYRQKNTWKAATSQMEKLVLAGAGVQNGVELLQSEFLRRNTIDFWWLHARLRGDNSPGAWACVALALSSLWGIWHFDRKHKMEEE